MDRCKYLMATVLIAILSIPTITHAALVGRLAATEGGTDYQAYYDTESNLTWLADANAAIGSIQDTYSPGSGLMNWNDASNWVTGLTVNGVADWRLPDTIQPDTNCDNTSNEGINYGFNCTGSEMGNLFYNVLGGTTTSFLSTTHNANYDLFNIIQGSFYWSGSEIDITFHSDAAMAFKFSSGNQDVGFKDYSFYAWAVQSGDVAVSAVPVPAAVWLFGSGLIGLVGFARRNKT